MGLFPEDSQKDNYIVHLDKRWQLDDLSVFSKAYEETYFAMFGLLSAAGQMSGDASATQRVSHAFRSYPWTGGYSAVNFFTALKKSVPRKDRPTVLRITYASPGIIELLLAQHVAVQIGAVVASVCGSVRLANSTYHAVYKGYIDRQLARVSVERAELELSREKLEFVESSNHALARELMIDNVDVVDRQTGNSLRTLKILLAIHRRMHKLAKLQDSGKIKLSGDD